MIETVRDYVRWNVPHPIPYQGSKRNLAPIILSYFPSHAIRLVEPFAGSAAISLATAYKGLADSFLINDAHAPIIDLWREIIEHPEEFQLFAVHAIAPNLGLASIARIGSTSDK
jgi:site-specific DNA-adenine methylase